MYYSYVEIDYVATSFSPARTDLVLKLLRIVAHTTPCSLASGVYIIPGMIYSAFILRTSIVLCFVVLAVPVLLVICLNDIRNGGLMVTLPSFLLLHSKVCFVYPVWISVLNGFFKKACQYLLLMHSGY